MRQHLLDDIFSQFEVKTQFTLSNSHAKTFPVEFVPKCSGFSGTLESILLALLHNQDQLERSLAAARHDTQREVERLREELGQEVRQRERERKGVEQMIADGLSKASGDVASQGRYSVLS